MLAKLRIEADVTLPEKREKAGGCVVTQWSSCFSDAGGVSKTRVMGAFLGRGRIQIGTKTVPRFWALFSVHLRRIVQLPNILPIFSGQKAGHVFVQVLVCLSSAPGFCFFFRVRRPPQSGAGASGWPRRRSALGRSCCC